MLLLLLLAVLSFHCRRGRGQLRHYRDRNCSVAAAGRGQYDASAHPAFRADLTVTELLLPRPQLVMAWVCCSVLLPWPIRRRASE